MRRTILCLLVLGTMLFAPPALAKKKPVIRAPGGTPLDGLGMVIDASYDKRLDNFVPGYKVVNVALVNQSFDIIYLNLEGDRWAIKVGKREQKAIHDLHSQNPKAWSELPKRAQGIVAYPLVLPIGGREVVDLFIPDSVDLEELTELDLYLKSLDQKIEIIVRQ